VLGICGGFQMLGRTVADPHGVEAEPGTCVEGLGLLDVRTDFTPDKVLGLRRGAGLGAATGGYEIHHGLVTRGAGAEEFPGGARAGAIHGTMWHGSLEHDGFRAALLAEVAALHGVAWRPSGVSFAAARERRLDLLADLVEQHLDLDALHQLAREGAPPDLPLLPPGALR
jgi:adenosylcobyric acid synthase